MPLNISEALPHPSQGPVIAPSGRCREGMKRCPARCPAQLLSSWTQCLVSQAGCEAEVAFRRDSDTPRKPTGLMELLLLPTRCLLAGPRIPSLSTSRDLALWAVQGCLEKQCGQDVISLYVCFPSSLKNSFRNFLERPSLEHSSCSINVYE